MVEEEILEIWEWNWFNSFCDSQEPIHRYHELLEGEQREESEEEEQIEGEEVEQAEGEQEGYEEPVEGEEVEQAEGEQEGDEEQGEGVCESIEE